MAKDSREILEVLQGELHFIQKEGYATSAGTPWLPKSIFQDSPTCANYGYPYRAHPCCECLLVDFVAPQDRSQMVPCHFIPLDDSGTTIEELELEGNESKAQNKVVTWLKKEISLIGRERARRFWENVD